MVIGSIRGAALISRGLIVGPHIIGCGDFRAAPSQGRARAVEQSSHKCNICPADLLHFHTHFPTEYKRYKHMAWNDRRPMSPHLQIYKLPLTALLSVGHRGTGAALGIGGLMIVCLLASAASGEAAYATAHTLVSSWFGKFVLFGFTFALYLHFFNGIRHLFWDVGKGFDLETTKKSAQAAIIATLVMTTVTWLVAAA